MKCSDLSRRKFLAAAGLGAVGLAGQVSSEAAPSSAEGGNLENQVPVRSVLITSGETLLAQAIAAGLSPAYRVSLTSQVDVQTDYPVTRAALEAGEATGALVRGKDAIVHVAQPATADADTVPIDHRTRLTYNLLQAAARSGVRQLVYLSSIELLVDYAESFEVTEDWRPRPGADPRLLSHYLGEFTCREFAREGSLSVVILRLGNVVRAEEVAGQPADPLRVDQRDVVHAVALALAAMEADDGRRLAPWSVFHVLADSPHSRFPVEKAKRILGYKPQSQG